MSTAVTTATVTDTGKLAVCPWLELGGKCWQLHVLFLLYSYTMLVVLLFFLILYYCCCRRRKFMGDNPQTVASGSYLNADGAEGGGGGWEDPEKTDEGDDDSDQTDNTDWWLWTDMSPEMRRAAQGGEPEPDGVVWEMNQDDRMAQCEMEDWYLYAMTPDDDGVMCDHDGCHHVKRVKPMWEGEEEWEEVEEYGPGEGPATARPVSTRPTSPVNPNEKNIQEEGPAFGVEDVEAMEGGGIVRERSARKYY